MSAASTFSFIGALLGAALQALRSIGPAAVIGLAAWAGTGAGGQTLEDLLDDELYVRGLADLRLPELLEHYIQTHPPEDGVQAALYDLARQRLALSEPGLDAQERVRVLARSAEIRRTMIADHPADPRRPIWMADLAVELLFDALPIDGADLSAVFGLPSHEQRSRAQALAREILELAKAAELGLDRAMLDLESMPGFAESVTLQQRRRDLAEREKARRLPFLRGVAAVMHAELNEPGEAERRALHDEAARLLIPLRDSLQGAAAIACGVYGGIALARLGRFDEAQALLDEIAASEGLSPADMFAVRMAGVLNRQHNRGQEAALAVLDSIEQKYLGPNDLFFRVIVIDRRFLIRLEAAMQASGSDRLTLTTTALATYTELITRPPPAGVPRETVQSIAMGRLAAAAERLPPDVPIEKLPAIVTVGRAQQLARNAQTREAAIVMLEQAIASPGLTDAERAAGLFALGKALFEHGHTLFAAQRFIELARDLPSQGQAEQAIELGATLAADLYRSDSADHEAQAALRDALAVMIDRYVNLPTIDRWLYEAGKLALADEQVDRAIELFAKVGADAPVHLDAQYMRAVAARAAVPKAADNGARTAAAERAIGESQRATDVIGAAIAAASDQMRAADLRQYLGMLQVFRAQSFLDLNKPEQALESVAGFERDASLEPQVVGEALKVRIDAYQALKRPAEALREVEQYIQAAPQQAGGVLSPMLDALERDVLALLDDGRDEQATELARATLLPVAELLDRWLREREASDRQQQEFGRRVADAFRHSGEFERALQWYDRLLEAEPSALELLVGRAESLYHLGGEARMADAMTAYKRIAAAGPAAGDDYWLAQLRMLQVIDTVNRRTEQILPRIERLRQENAKFGGERFRRGFEALRNKYAA